MKRLCTIARSGIAVALLAALAGAGCAKNGISDDDPVTPSKQSTDEAIDKWMFNYMKTHYLWNAAVKEVKPDYSLGYEDFLDDVLTKVAAQKDVNHDDGHWKDGKREYFYSNVQRYKKSAAAGGIATRGTRETAEGLGIEMMYYAALGPKGTSSYAFIIAAVAPGSPADKAGLMRGDVISRIDGAEIREANLQTAWTKLIATELGAVRVTKLDLNTGVTAEITLTAATYDDTPLWEQKIIETENGKKVGYLVYGSFNYYYDDALIEVFEEFRREQIDDLVLDLRYNGGGHVVSSAVLGTLIAGDAYKGCVYAETTYNADRASETPDVYKLGVAQYNAKRADYRHDAIAGALAAAVGVERVYVLCTSSTASASELIINGLRGLDFEVRLIGKTTNGKNVGMEVLEKVFGSYEYEFSPITFYIANAKGERDYGDGFEPDVEAEDRLYYLDENSAYCKIDWGDEKNDRLLACALSWIETGRKSVVDTVSTRAFGGLQPRILREVRSPRVQEMLRLPVAEE